MILHADYGEGGAGVGTKTTRHPGIGDVLRGLVDDIGNKDVATIATADAVPSVAAPTKTEFDAVVTLVNEIKAALNASTTASATKNVTKA